jgi:hypothetical protein
MSFSSHGMGMCGIAPCRSSPGRRHRSAGRRLWHVATAVHYRNSDRVRALPSGKSKTSLSGTRRIPGISLSYQNAHPGETVATNASPVKRILEAIRKLHEADGQKIDTGIGRRRSRSQARHVQLRCDRCAARCATATHRPRRAPSRQEPGRFSDRSFLALAHQLGVPASQPSVLSPSSNALALERRHEVVQLASALDRCTSTS